MILVAARISAENWSLSSAIEVAVERQDGVHKELRPSDRLGQAPESKLKHAVMYVSVMIHKI
jgi:hypothetical protein